jgi:hypothetical protein
LEAGWRLVSDSFSMMMRDPLRAEGSVTSGALVNEAKLPVCRAVGSRKITAALSDMHRDQGHSHFVA